MLIGFSLRWWSRVILKSYAVARASSVSVQPKFDLLIRIPTVWLPDDRTLIGRKKTSLVKLMPR